MTQNGELVLSFSEELMPLSYFSGINISLSDMTSFLEVTYTCVSCMEGDSQAKLENFKVLNFTANKMVIHLNFSNPIYVSSN
jgi:hypothetical protein